MDTISQILAVESIGDSLYFDVVIGMHHVPGKGFFVSMLGERKILHLGDDLKPVNIIGKPGEGPGELSYPAHIISHFDSLYVADGRIIEVYTLLGKYIRSFNMPMYDEVFGVMENYVYAGTKSERNPISKIGLNGEVIFGFGEWRHSDKEGYYRVLNSRFVKPLISETLVSVIMTEPIIEIYSPQGQL
ncbi:hypothetical protein GQ464_008090 [Rhodocaloribacter litoris]|uniref:hypothetical protein n=1 Tax=Rhodocaloribacter litoris TaxID=2558931 RepID=UPI00141E1446|nr:hypothetical protein [Rhodocaloribacter litoris]QXD16887.1 hypothetical protein GQ464_008090 [Rhodocaloribacter litoris]